jgi:hypothetical protein
MNSVFPAINEAYREARLALLSARAQQQIERTDASLREVEAAIARLKSSLPNGSA